MPRSLDYSRSQLERVIQAYADWLLQRLEAGWHPFFLTFMYKPLPGSREAKLSQMTAETERVYRILVTRIIRWPNRVAAYELPFMIASPDLPVPKTARKRTVPMALIRINNGLHYHALFLTPPNSRMRISLDEHIDQKQSIYAASDSRLIRLDAQPIAYTPEKMVRYGMKAIEGLRLDDFYTVLLPKTSREVLDTWRRKAA